MGSEQRLKRLRELIAQLERLPPTAERERMLRDVRGRLVDVDTGEAPSPLARDADGPKPAAKPRPVPPAAKQRPAPPRPPMVVVPKPVVRSLPPKPVQSPPPSEPVRRPPTEFTADVLWLDDSLEPWAPGEEAAKSPAPWTRGLRG